MKTCSKENCNKKHYGKGLCRNHWVQWKYANDIQYRQLRIASTTKAKKKWLEKDENRLKHNEQNLSNMHKRYSSNDKYRAIEQERTKNFRKNKYHNDENFKNKEIIAARQREKVIKQRTPKWANIEAINEFYNDRPKGFHVDHLVPLRGKYVSGLHVLENLQYLTEEENLKKGNKF